ncbi:unnamed protein product [Trichobilharzia szidati]|nr:unnamed protein product [Trichobilharzia szidati]
MSVNHDGFKLSSLIPDISSHNHEKSWTRLYDPDVKKTKSAAGNPVDYSMHSPTHEYKTSAFTSVTSSVLSRSNYNYGVIQPQSYQNDCSNSTASCNLRVIPKCLDYNLKSGANDDERPLKRKYSRSTSNISGKYNAKYVRTKIGDNNESNYNKLNDTDQSTGSETNNYNTDTTSKLLSETYLLTKHPSHKNMNTSVRKDTKMDKMKTSESVSSYSKSNTQTKEQEEDGTVINTSRCNTNDKEKGTTVSGAAYKYLTWREKDRRRRFREEWKHLWLVIPHGLYEVMCLVCHKVMTQRKVDTIKRHTVRRHSELIGLSELEREHLFNELMKQYSMLEANNNYNPSSDVHTKRSRKSNEIHYSTRDICSIPSTEQFERLPNTSCCLDSQSSEMNTVKSSSVSSDSGMNEISAFRSTSYRKSKNSFNKPFQKVSPTSKPTTNLSNYGREDLLRIPHDSSTVENVKVLQSNISTNTYNTPNFIVNSPTFEKSPRASNSCYSSDHSIFENKSYNTTFTSKIGPCVPSFPTSLISPLSPISMDPSSTMNSSLSPGFSCISPHNDNEKQSFDLKSAINFQSFASTLLSPSSSSLFLPELLSTFSNINKLCTSSSLNKDKHMYMSDKSAIYGSPEGNMNYSPIKTHENTQFKNIAAKQIILNSDHNVNCGKTRESLLTPRTLITNQTLDNKNHNVSMLQPISSNGDSSFQHTSPLSSASTSTYLQNSFNFLTPPPPPFLMNALTKALMNNVPMSNQEIADILSQGFCKTALNASSNIEKSCESDEPLSHEVYRNYSTSSNPCIQGNSSSLQEKESGISPSSCTDPKRLHRPTVTTTSVCPKDPICQAKSSKNLNKFTISSLLDTESSPTTRKVTKTKTGSSSQVAHSNSKKHKTSPISDCNHPPPRQNGLQENFTFAQTPKYHPCVLCSLEGKNPGVCEAADTMFSADNLCRTSANIFHQDLYNLHNEKQQVFNNCLELPSSSVNAGTLEHNRSLYGTCHSNKDICNSIYNHKDQVKFDALSNLNNFKNQDFSTFEACMKFYYLELLRHHYDNIAKANHSTQFGLMSECAPIVEKNGSTGFTDPSEDYNKLSNKD